MIGGSSNYRGAVSNILKYNLPETTLLFSNEDGKIQAFSDLPSNLITYLDGLRENVQLQIDTKSNSTYLNESFLYKNYKLMVFLVV